MTVISQDDARKINISRILSVAVLFSVTLAVYWQVRNHDFIEYDDNVYVTDNYTLQRGINFETIVWAMTTTHTGYWHPVTWLSHMVDFEVYGLNPRGHHFTSLLLHIINTFLLLSVLFRMTGEYWKCFFVAALFALHPLHVDSVAWVSERKDVLSMLFLMLTLHCYVIYVKRPTKAGYLSALILFALGLMAKPILVTLPFVLFLVDYWPLKRISFPHSRQDEPLTAGNCRPCLTAEGRLETLILEKVPFLALSLLSGAFTFLAQKSGGSVVPLETLNIESRVLNALVSYITYIKKMFWPSELAVFYPFKSPAIFHGIMAAFILVIVSAVAIRLARTYKYVPVGWFWYLVTLLPVIGIIHVGMQSHADRYTYIPLTGLFIIVSFGLPDFLRKRRVASFLIPPAAIIVMSALTIATKYQISHWQNTITLFNHAAMVTEKNYLAYNSIGFALEKEGKPHDALEYFRKAIEASPMYSAAYYNMGCTLARLGRCKEAVSYLDKALELNPLRSDAHNVLGYCYYAEGKYDEAYKHYSKALQINPEYADAHGNMGVLLKKQGRLDEADKHYAKSLQIRPTPGALFNLGLLKEAQNKHDEARRLYSEALKLDPDYSKAMMRLEEISTPK